ncbi:peptidyl-prolyl cis-trans isomerase [uncultured Desulfuromusa sp.]|uniref:peptidylprolyl isomerase n=1 Tax=uncultured Desulfuromusa sp. TaxID=219183 RepID=UPI002AA842B1|nr:peptidyl-prolyl cis-trans isomerase [uncultured Desulfuromusa sp.]
MNCSKYGEKSIILLKLTRGLISFFLLFLLSCQQQEQPPQGPLLEVGQRQLTLQQFNRELQKSYSDISALTDEEQLQFKKQLLKEIIDRELILGEATRLDIQITPDELDAAMAEVRGSYSEEEFTKVLEQTGNTLETWIAALRLRLLTTKVATAAQTSPVQVSDSECKKYYQDHREEFNRPVEIRARQMLFKTRDEANKVHKLLKEGGDFAALAKKYSQSPDRENGGALGYFSAGQLPAEFDAVLFKLPVRQFSDPVESPYGFHLFVVERKRKAGLRPYAAVKDEIAELLYQQKEETAFHLWLENLQETTETHIHWELLQPQSLQ